MKLAILGAGAWGTALAIHFAKEHSVTLWTREATHYQIMQQTRENPLLPHFHLPDSIGLSMEMAHAIADAALIFIVTPTAGLRETLCNIARLGSNTPIIWACKGLEADTQQLAHQIANDELPANTLRGVFTGPSFAQEVAKGLPAALTLASNNSGFAHETAIALHSSTLRIYSSTDVIGAEIGGAVKNIMAIAAGVSDGLQLGYNARAALITRGLAETTRLGVAMGAQPATFTGLSGLGDLILTCTGDLSRNRTVGLLLAKGHALSDIVAQLGHVAEGVNTAKAVLAQAERLGISMPITQSVCAMLFEQVPAQQAIAALMQRASKQEA